MQSSRSTIINVMSASHAIRRIAYSLIYIKLIIEAHGHRKPSQLQGSPSLG